MQRLIRRSSRSTNGSLWFAMALAALLATAAATVDAQIPGPNVNMVSGTTLPDGDPFLQRQNEPSGAVSTRNPLHLLAGANDYRTVDIPGLSNDNEEAKGDAWLGIFKSFDGGQTWRSTLLPGYPQDPTPVGKASPLHGYAAGADATMRAGTNGLFYYSGLAFNRGSNGLGVLFVARFIDNNNAPGGDPIPYLDTNIVDKGTAGQFVDKPTMAVDVPRQGAGTCTIQAPGTKAPQVIAAGNVYVAYVTFLGNTKNPVSKLMVSRSTTCGTTWSTPIKVSERVHVNQGATMALDPATGDVYIAWREFADNSSPAAILVIKSTDGAKTFSKPVVLAKITPFDQGGSLTTFRTNSYPTMTIDGTGRVYVAWAERWIPAPGGDARIVMTRSLDGGVTWTPRQPIETARIDPASRQKVAPVRGHQVMPAVSVVGGKVTVIYYDFGDDISPVRGTYVNDAGASKRHTVDVRVAQADPAKDPANAPKFGPSVRVSQYLMGSLKGSRNIGQLQFNAPNLPLYSQGEKAFIGDYIDVSGVAFVQDASGKWVYNTSSSGPNAMFAFWTDNRDVRAPKDGNWKNYTPPAVLNPFTGQIGVCAVGQTGMRNANIYMSRITPGLFVGAPTNAKRLYPGALGVGSSSARSFVVFAQNNTPYDPNGPHDQTRLYRFVIAAQPNVEASFIQFPKAGLPLTTLDVAIGPASTASRTVYATSADPTASVTVNIFEVQNPATPATPPLGLPPSSIVLNPDVTNPDVTNPDVTNAEVFNPDVTNPDVTNPDVTNPDVTNPDVTNPDVTNVVLANPDVTNPDVTNLDVTNPDVTNPDVTNPDVTNLDVTNGTMVDVTWTVKNSGNTAGSFSVKPFLTKNAPAGFKKQLLLHKTYTTPITSPGLNNNGCDVKTQSQTILLANILNPDVTNPDVTNPDVTNATLSLDPGESAKITLRVLAPNHNTSFSNVVTKAVTLSQSDGSTVQRDVILPAGIDPVTGREPDLSTQATTAVASQAVGTVDSQAGITIPPVEIALIVDQTSLPSGGVGQPYSTTLTATGGDGSSRTWSPANGSLLPGVTLSSGGVISGTPLSGLPGGAAFFFTVKVVDAAHTNTADLFILINNLPAAAPETVSTNEDTAVGITLSGSDVETSAAGFTYTVTMPPANGMLSALTVPGTAPTITYTPSANYNGPDSFNYVVTDTGNPAGCGPVSSTCAAPLTSAAATVSITVTPVNDAPSFTKGADQTVLEDAGAQSVVGWATPISAGPANESGQTLDFIVSNNNNALFSVQPAVSASGVLTYTPAANTNGIATVSVQIRDNGGTANNGIDTSTPQTFTITVTPVNDPPTANADSASTLEDQPVSIDVLANDTSAPDTGETLQVLSVTHPLNGIAVLCAPAPPGLIAWWSGDGDSNDISGTNHGTPVGGVTFVPGKVGSAFSFNSVDGVVATPLTVSYSGGATFDAWIRTTADKGVVVTDAGGASAFSGMGLFVEPAGRINLFGTKGTSGTFNFSIQGPVVNDGAYHHVAGTWTGDTSANGAKLYVDGALVGSATALGTITTGTSPFSIGWQSTDATHSPFNGQIDEAHVYNRALRTKEVQEGFFAGVAGLCKPAPAGSSTGTATGTWAGSSVPTTGDAELVMTQLQQNGSNLTGTSVDGSSSIVGTTLTPTADVQTYNVTVTETNPDPNCPTTVSTGSFTIDTVNNALTGSVTGTILNCGLNVTSTISLRRTTGVGTGVIYWPNDNFNGTDSFSYTVSDGNGGTDTAPVTVTVTPVNDPPSFSIPLSFVSRLEDAGLQTIPNFVSNIERGPSDESSQRVTFVITGNSNPGLFSQAPQIDPNGTLTFTSAPNANTSGIGPAFITVQAVDNGGTANGGVDTSFSQSFQIQITPVNDPPSFTKGADQVVNEDTGFTSIPGWATNLNKGAFNEGNQSFGPSSSGYGFIVTNNTNGALFSQAPQVNVVNNSGLLSGTLTYQSASNAYGSATVTLVLRDSGGTSNGGNDTSAPQTFTITINPVNDQPTFSFFGANPTAFNNAGAQSVNLVTNISAGPLNETNGACVPLVPSVCQQTVNFNVSNDNNSLFSVQPSISPAGTLTYTPALGQNGNATVSFRLQDTGGTANGGLDTNPPANANPVTFTITVRAPLVITTTSLPPAITVQTYFASLNYSNGVGAVTWSLAPLSNPLPPGLAISGNQITGSPTRTGTFSFTVQAADSTTPTPQTATQDLSIVVSAIDQGNWGNGAVNTLGINSGQRIAQTVTVGVTGKLSAVSFQTLTCSTNPVTLTIEGVSPITGAPDDSHVFFTTTATINNLFQQIPVGPLFFGADQRLAIVLSTTGSCQVTNSSTSDTYSGGETFSSSSPWAPINGIADIQFQTLVQNADLTGMLRYRGQVRTVGISGGRVLIVGTDGTAEVFNPAKLEQVATRPMLHHRQDATATLLSNGKVLVVGGIEYPNNPGGPGTYLNSSEIYNPADNTWTPTAQMSVARAQHTATLLSDGRVLVAGGNTAPTPPDNFAPPVQSTDIYDADGVAATPGPAMVQSRAGHQATLLTCPSGNPACAWGGKVLMTGGYSNGPSLVSAELCDSNSLSQCTPTTGAMGTPRANHTATWLAGTGTVLVAGGQATQGPQTMATMAEKYDPGFGTFSAAGAMVEGRFWHTATPLGGDTVLFTGGLRKVEFNTNGAPWAAAEIYTGSGFTGAPSLDVTRYQHGAVPGADGLIAVAGGWSPSQQSGASIELYDPNGPAIQKPQLPDGSTSSAYPTTTLFGRGGTGPTYSFTLFSGAMPPGLTFTGGTIQGSPSATGTYPFVVQITDSSVPTARTAFQTLRIRINPLDITTTGLPNGFVNYPYSTTLAATRTSTWSLASGSGPLPDGLSLSSGGVINGTPTNQVGFKNFTVQAVDGEGQTARAGLGLPVNAANPPLAGNDSYSTNEDTQLTINAPGVLGNDSDQAVGQGGLTALRDSGPSHGTLTLNTNGSFTYTPSANFNGSDSFTYTANDGVQQSNQATVNINVNSVNDAPVANAQNVTTDEDTAKLITLTASDIDSPTLAYSIVTGPAHGTLSGTGSSRTYTPAPNYNGSDSFTFKANDGQLDSNVATVSIAVTPVNDPPTINVPSWFSSSTASLLPTGVSSERLPLSITVGDFNNDGKLDLATANQTSRDVSVLLGNGDGTFQPALASAAGLASFALATGDFNGDGKLDLAVSDTNSTKILLGNGNGTFQPPGAALDGGQQIVTGDFNHDGKLDLAIVSYYSSLRILLGNGNGTFQSAVSYLIGYGATGLTVADLNGDGVPDIVTDSPQTNTLSVLLGVGNGTFTPVADVAVQSGPYAVIAGDFNGDGKMDLVTGNQFSNNLALLLGNGDGTFQSPGYFPAGNTPLALGVGDFNRDGKLDLVVGDTNSHDVFVFPGNGNGTFSAPVTFLLAATSVPRGVAVADFDHDGRADFAVANQTTDDVTVFTNVLTVYTENTPPVVVTSDGTITDIDSPDFDTGTLTVDFLANGTADDRLAVRNQGTGLGQVGVSGNVVTFSGTQVGTWTGGFGGANPLVIAFNANATAAIAQAVLRNVTFENVSDNPSTAPRTLRFIVTDGDGGTSGAALKNIVVIPVNDAPVAANDSFTTNEDSTLSVPAPGVLANDSDPDGDPLSVVSFSTPTGFFGTVSVSPNGAFTFTPTANFNGFDTFFYTVTDGHGGFATGTVNLTVTPVNDAPSFTKGANQTVSDNAGAQTVTPWATYISAGPPDEGGQALDFFVSSDNNALFSAQPAVLPTGTLTYTPAVDANGTATVTVQVHDNGGIANGGVSTSLPQWFTITVNRSNQPPHAVDDSYSAINFSNLASLQLNGYALDYGYNAYGLPAIFNTGDGAVLRMTAAGNTESRGSAFTIGRVDVTHFSTTFKFRITNPCCDADDFGSVGADGFTFTLQSNAAGSSALGIDGGGTGLGYNGITPSVAVEFDTWHSGSVGDPDSNHLGLDLNGSVVSAQTQSVAPDFDNGQLWTAWIDYDGTTLEVRVSPNGVRPAAPTMARAINIPGILGGNTAFSGFTAATGVVYETIEIVNWTYSTPNAGVLVNDTDPEHDPLSIVSFTQPLNGTVVVNANGTFTYTPNAGYTGSDSFTYAIGDGHGNTASATVNIWVTEPPPP